MNRLKINSCINYIRKKFLKLNKIIQILNRYDFIINFILQKLMLWMRI